LTARPGGAQRGEAKNTKEKRGFFGPEFKPFPSKRKGGTTSGKKVERASVPARPPGYVSAGKGEVEGKTHPPIKSLLGPSLQSKKIKGKKVLGNYINHREGNLIRQ